MSKALYLQPYIFGVKETLIWDPSVPFGNSSPVAGSTEKSASLDSTK